MLVFLLDEHISPRVAKELRARCGETVCVCLREWQDGALLGADDSTLLSEAAEAGLTLVTYDVRTLAPLLKTWMESGLHFAGVVFVDTRTVAPTDIGLLVCSLEHLWRARSGEDWTDRVIFLTSSR